MTAQADRDFEDKIIALRAKLVERGTRMAKKGAGWENVYVKLRRYGMTKELAREIVLGKRK